MPRLICQVKDPCGAANVPQAVGNEHLAPGRVGEGSEVRRGVPPSQKVGPEKSEVSNTSLPNDSSKVRGRHFLLCLFIRLFVLDSLVGKIALEKLYVKQILTNTICV